MSTRGRPGVPTTTTLTVRVADVDQVRVQNTIRGRAVAVRDGPSTSGGPSAFLLGRAHLVMHGNLEFKAAYGAACLGQPAREMMMNMPRPGFELMDRVLTEGRALAMRVRMPGGDRGLAVAPRKDPETGETYGVIVHLRPALIPVPPEA